MGNKELLSQTVDVRLSLSDWLLLSGWASAHVTDETPAIIRACLHQMAKQVQG